MNSLLLWRKQNLRNECGVLVGCNDKQEKLIPLWLEKYSRNNSYPIAIINLGMSTEMQKWCFKRFEVIDINVPLNLLHKRLVYHSLLSGEQKESSHNQAYAWFRKPFSLLQSPFKRTIWIDVDAIVNKNIQQVFEYTQPPHWVAMALDQSENKIQQKIKKGILKPGELNYNTGVISYRYGADLIQKWALATIDIDGYFIGDQDIISRIAADLQITIPILPKKYNWLVPNDGVNPDATILHYSGNTKSQIITE